MHLSKRFKAAASAVDDKKAHTIDEAVAAVKAAATAKFTESVDIAVRLGVDPKKAVFRFFVLLWPVCVVYYPAFSKATPSVAG